MKEIREPLTAAEIQAEERLQQTDGKVSALYYCKRYKLPDRALIMEALYLLDRLEEKIK